MRGGGDDVGRDARARRAPRAFGLYAAMEAGNIVLLPALAVFLTRPDSGPEIAALALASFAAGVFLLVGTLYWRGVHRRLRHGDGQALRRAVAFADRAERPGLALILLSALVFLWALGSEGWSGAVIAGGALTLLALLEWVNYYRRQLQHFDNGADLRRLLSGRGFKRSHLGRELAAYRRSRTTA